MTKPYGESDNGSINSCKERIKDYFSTPVFTGSYAERQAQWVKHHDIKVGSKVKMVRKFENKESGFHFVAGGTTKTVGKTFEVTSFKSSFNDVCICSTDGMYYPYFVLEPVK